MKLLTALVLLGSTQLAFAQYVLECNFKINDNKTKRDAKELRQSETKIQVELFEGMEYKDDIKINRVILHPGEKKTDQYLVRLFETDTRDEQLKSDKDLKSVRMSRSEVLSVNVSQSARTTTIALKSNTGDYNIRFNGEGVARHNFFLYSRYSFLKKDRTYNKISPIVGSCQRLPRELVDESEIKKGEVNPLEEERHLKKGTVTRAE
jgi:hypothetical protein